MSSPKFCRSFLPVILSHITLKRFTTFLLPIKCVQSKKCLKTIPILSVSFLMFHKAGLKELLAQADSLYSEERYLDAYTVLYEQRHQNSVEINWRMCRALFKLGDEEKFLKEATNIIDTSLRLYDHPEIHKWKAILLQIELRKKFSLDTIDEMKKHLLMAIKLKPDDIICLHMLGTWCYTVATINWLQRQIIKYKYKRNPPVSTVNEAKDYFSEVEELKPRFLVSNVYMLGLSHYKLGNMYCAYYYLSTAAKMNAWLPTDRIAITEAAALAEKLKHYSLNTKLFFHKNVNH